VNTILNNRDAFTALLVQAAESAIQFAQRYVSQALPMRPLYQIHFNESYDEGSSGNFVRYPEDDGKVLEMVDQEEAVDQLLRKGRCPEWVDVSAFAVTPSATLLKLVCCGRFTSDEASLYYASAGMGPFGVKSPELPARHVSGAFFTLPEFTGAPAPLP
jgi:hypothetical protein